MSRQKGSRILFCVAPSGPFREKVPGTFLPPLGKRSGARAFTLVELVTVMGILAILTALIVGAAQGLHDRAARGTTVRILAALDAALQRYYDDWGKFPWYKNESGDLVELLGPVAGALDDEAVPSYCPVRRDDAGMETRVGAMLYAALNMRERNGPYISGGAGNVKAVRLKSSEYRACRVYVDGWGRPIHYFQPQTDHSINPPRLVPMPLLMSEGSTEDFFNEMQQGDIWPDRSKVDNLTNYDLHAMNITSLEIDDSNRKY